MPRASKSTSQINEKNTNDTERAEIQRRATEIGITTMIKYYEELNPKCPLPSSNVYTWKVQYKDKVRT